MRVERSKTELDTDHVLISDHCRALVSSSVGAAYVYVHTHHCLHPLPWDSPLTWLAAAIGIDFCYYWVHRAAHGDSSYLDIDLIIT